MTTSRAYALRPERALRRRTLLCGAASIAALGALWASTGAPRFFPQRATGSPTSAPAGLAELPAAARGPISAAVGADRSAYRVRAAGGKILAAVGGSQGMRASFDPAGVTLASGSAKLRLRLRAAGYGGSLRPIGAATPYPAANRVSYARGGLSEWYANGPLGVEQGFTVKRRPATAGDATLELVVGVSGNLRAVSDGARGVAFHAAHGETIRYGAISATDSTGLQLPSRMALKEGAIQLRVDTSGARFPVTVDPLIAQDERPTPTDEASTGRFGYSVALSADGTTALIGAPGENGFAGAAWVFTRAGSTWTQQGPKLTASDQAGEAEAECLEEASECGFGRSVALSADGSTALVGAPRAHEARGAAWVFTRAGSTWSQLGEKLTAGLEASGNGSFGRSVALSADGGTALVGAPRDTRLHGAAWAFTRSGSGFVALGAALTGALEIGGGYFGRSVALSADGTTALIGGPGDDGYLGAAWVYARSGSDWIAQGEKLTAGAQEIGQGRFGSSVALSAAGDTALIGARTDNGHIGAAWLLARSGSAWAQPGAKISAQGELGEGQLGSSVALSGDGATALIGGPHDNSSVGAAWTFTRAGATWAQESEQFGGGAEPGRGAFGTGVALSSDGATALIGAPREAGRRGGAWAFLGTPPAPQPPIEPSPPAGKVGSPAAQAGSTSSTLVARSGVLASTTSALPPPTLARTANIVPLSGVVRVKLPGSPVFTLLVEGEQIPFGSIIDARRGRVSITTANAHGALQTVIFYEGEFKLTQRRDGLVVSTLFGDDFSRCPTLASGRARRATATKAKHAVRKLWAEGHGSYSTKGSYATGAVLGTRWLTADLCEGTLIRVVTDQVAVKNLVTGRRLTVRAGHSYLARANRSRHH